MLNLDSPLVLDTAAILSPNLCSRFSDADLNRIGEECWAGYTRDDYSRSDWMRRNEAGMDLALQLQKDKSFPWPGCSNVAFPLVTIAAMQFHARAYPAIVSGTDVVKCEVEGPDPSGQITKRAKRISTHMSWQCLKQDRAWEEQEDKCEFNLSIVGTNFKKSYRDVSRSINVSELVLAKDLVVDYWTKCLEAAPRVTHLIPMQRNDVRERVLREVFRDILEEQWYTATPSANRTQQQVDQDKRQGVSPPQSDETTPLFLAEQHVNMDLDDDGYAEPYIITFDTTSKNVLRIVTRFDSDAAIERVAIGPKKGKIIRITAADYFTKREFIPSPDGGFYGIGFGVFLGPLNEAVNTLVNQLIDAGTMQTTSGGFLGRGAKIRGGVYTFAPFEWKRVDSSGEDLNKNIVPYKTNQPSDVLFQLLSLLINYTNRIAGTTDMMVGENPGQNTPAETSRTMVEMGQKIYTAIFKRMWRGLADEFRKLYKLNGQYMLPGQIVPGGATLDDYRGNPDEICPAADPNITSDAMQFNQAQSVFALSNQAPGFNKDEVVRRVLKGLKVDAIDQIFPGSEGQTPPEDPKVTIEKMKIEFQKEKLQSEQQEFVMELQEKRRMNDAAIIELQAKADQEAALAETEAQYAQVAAINARISEAKARSDHYNSSIDATLKAMKILSDHKIGMVQASQPKAKAA